MFKSLQARLTLSYVLIILLCLVLVGLAALVLLRGYQETVVYRRLTDRAVLSAGLISQSLRRGVSLQQVVDRLPGQRITGPSQPMITYLLDAEGNIIAGSHDKLEGERFAELALPARPSPDWRRRGERRLPSGERYLYVAELVRDSEATAAAREYYVLLQTEQFLPIRTTLRDLLPRLAWAGVLALFVSIIIAALMAYSIARPLDRISRAAEEIAAGHYDQELDISSPAEIARLATSFNSMARQVNVTMRSQQDLVANVSHDLKTPLTSIQGFSQALLDGTASDEIAQKRAAAVIHEEASRMRRLVDDLLELARLESGQVVLAREMVDVAQLLQECSTRFGPQSEQLGVTLVVETTDALPPIIGDPDRLGQVLGNLVDNALKHAQREDGAGRVELRAGQEGRTLACTVSDNGPGIPAEDRARVFERFYQVDKSRARRTGGAGLGLAIAQELALAHGGQIRVESVEGLGTRFTVELPLPGDS
jgi:two-component system OmpR family sensor kinase